MISQNGTHAMIGTGVSDRPPPSALHARVLESLPEVVFATDADGTWTYLNPAWTKLTGFTVDESLGRSFLDFIWINDRDLHSTQFTHAIAGDQIFSRHEVRYLTKTGRHRWVEVHVNLDRDPEGRLIGTYGSLTDITDRKLDRVLSKGEQSVMKVILSGAPLEVLLEHICHLTQILLRGSRCSILLLDPDGMRLRHGAGPNLPAGYMAAIDGAAIGPAAGSCGMAALTKRPVIVTDIASDPSWCEYGELALAHGLRACCSLPIMVAGGEVYGTFAIYHEVAHAPDEWEVGIAHRLARLAAVSIMRKRSDEALRISEERYALAVQGASVGIWDWDIERDTLYWSPLFKRMVGLAPEEEPLPRATFNQLLHAEDRDRVEEVLQRHLTDRVPFDTRYRLRLPNGTVRWFHARAQAVWNTGGRAIRIAGSIHDITDQVKASQQIRDSEARFRDFADVASDWFWETDAGHRFSYFSERISEHLDVDPTTWLGLNRMEISAEAMNLPLWQQHFADLNAHRPFRNFEYEARGPDQQTRWFRASGKPMFDATGQFIGYRGTGTNITAQKLAENARRRSEARAVRAEQILLDAIESLSDGFILLDADRRFVMCNSRYRQMFPAVVDMLVPGTCYESICRYFAANRRFVDKRDHDAWISRRLAPVGDGRYQEEQLADGRWVRISDFPTRDGGVAGLRADITEAKHQERMLRKREQELLEAQKIARMGHWRLDVITGEYEWSAGMYQIMEASLDDYRPTLEDILARIHDPDRDEAARRLAECVATGAASQWEFRIRNHEDRMVIWKSEGHCEFGTDGSVTSVFGICRDVTAERQAEEMLRAARDAAEAASRAKSEFLANMSHELRTPLNAIIGFSDMLRLEVLGPLGQRYREYAGDIHRSGQHLLELINDLLDTARVEAGKVDLHEEPVALDQLINEAIPLSRSVSSGIQHSFELDIPSPAPVLLVDLRCLKQVLINLIGNAVKFTPDGGRIAVKVGISSNAVAVMVTDSGIGIPQERIGDLGRPFSQVESAMARRHGGSGMGLFISKSLVERHGGKLSIDSRFGSGTTVTITLPLERLLAVQSTG